MGKRCVAIVGFVASLACENEYPLSPTPCDNYCLALQRADCPEDWPDECVSRCEFEISPTRHPDCAGEFDALLGCYQALDDDDFACVDDESQARAGSCEGEEFEMGACIEPILFRWLTLCERWAEDCKLIEFQQCWMSRPEVRPGCEEEGVRYLDCELADEASCSITYGCQPLRDELTQCVLDWYERQRQ